MIVLGLDTATRGDRRRRCGSATAARCEARDDPAAGGPPGPRDAAARRWPRSCSSEAGLGWGRLDRIAVGVGPGTFTGLRVGIATARGLAQSLGIELVGVSSLRALAHGARGGEERVARTVLAVIDARRGEVFAAAYSPLGRGAAAPRGRALPPAELATVLAEAGAADGAPLGVGDGAVRYRVELEAGRRRGAAGRSRRFTCCAPRRSASSGSPLPAGRYAEVLPDYLRRPDAELALEGAARGVA